MDTIINPLNGEEHSINSVKGKEILQNYIKLYKNGGAEGDESIVVPPVPSPRWMRRLPRNAIELHNIHIARLNELLQQVEDNWIMDDDERFDYVDFLRDVIEGLERQRDVLARGNAARDFSGLSERNYLDPDPEHPNLLEHIERELERRPEVLREHGVIGSERDLAESASVTIAARERAARNLSPVNGRWVGDVWVTDTNQDARLANQVEETTSVPSFPAQGYDPTFAAADNPDVPINEHFDETRRNNIRRHQGRM